MTTKTFPPAFPTPGRTEMRPVPGVPGAKIEHVVSAKDGMTLRDYFAAQIASGDAAASSWPDGITAELAKKRARTYFAIADAMLAVRDE